jgi:hypothetical protein
MIDQHAPKLPHGKPAMLIWAGMGVWDWLRLLAANRFAIDRGFRALALRNTLGSTPQT